MNFNGFVSYIFLILAWFFQWSPFLKFSNISKKHKNLFISNEPWYFYLWQDSNWLIWLFWNKLCISLLVSFWIWTKYFSSNAIDFLVVNRKFVSYDWKIQWVIVLKIVEFDGSFLIIQLLVLYRRQTFSQVKIRYISWTSIAVCATYVN